MIEVKNLTKKYGDHTALNDVSFTIEDGKIYGFLGPNGAGKSTTMNIITGCITATSGNVYVDNFDISENPMEAKKLIGYLPEIPPLYVDMKVEEYLKFICEAKGIKKADIAKEVDRVLEKAIIADVRGRLIRNLSKGYRQRVGIAQAIVGKPKLLILDEPTVGLDPRQIKEVRELIKELGKESTVILSSHILSEIDYVCENIILICNGNLITNDTKDNLEQRYEKNLEDIYLMITAESGNKGIDNSSKDSRKG